MSTLVLTMMTNATFSLAYHCFVWASQTTTDLNGTGFVDVAHEWSVVGMPGKHLVICIINIKSARIKYNLNLALCIIKSFVYSNNE